MRLGLGLLFRFLSLLLLAQDLLGQRARRHQAFPELGKTLGGGEAEICRVGANGRESAGGSADGRDVGSGRNARHGAPRNRGTEGWRCLGRRGRSGRAEKALRGGLRSEEHTSELQSLM